MLKYYKKVLFMFLAIVCLFSFNVFAQDKSSIAVIEIESIDLQPTGLKILTDVVRNEVVNSRKYQVIDELQTRQVVKNKNFSVDQINNPKYIREIGMALGVKYLVTGRIGKLGNLYLVNLWMIDVESGGVVSNEIEEYTGNLEELRNPVRSCIQKLLKIEGIELKKETYLSVNSNPEGAMVYINGYYEGNTPFKMNIKKAGEYSVKVWAPGYEEWKRNVDVKENLTSFVDAKMLKNVVKMDNGVLRNINRDGRPFFIGFTTLYSVLFSEFTLTSFNVQNDRTYIGAALLSAPTAFFLTLKFTGETEMSWARTMMATSSTFWGSLWGISAMAIFDSQAKGQSLNAYYGLSALGGAVGYTCSLIFTRDGRISPGRVGLINLGSFMGTLAGLGIPFMFNVDHHQIYFGCMLSGGILGGLYSIWLTRNYDSRHELIGLNDSVIENNDGKISYNVPVNLALNFVSYLAVENLTEKRNCRSKEYIEQSFSFPVYTAKF